MKTPHQILGVKMNASAAEIKSAYRALARKWHPDRHPTGSSKLAHKRMAEITVAYDELTRPEKKRQRPAAQRQSRQQSNRRPQARVRNQAARDQINLGASLLEFLLGIPLKRSIFRIVDEIEDRQK